MKHQLKDFLSYYLQENNKRIRDKFFYSVLYGLFDHYFNIALTQYRIYKNTSIYQDLRQDLFTLTLDKLNEIQKAKDCSDFLFVLCKNFIINYLKKNTLYSNKFIFIFDETIEINNAGEHDASQEPVLNQDAEN